MQVRVRDVQFATTECTTRLPFRFGAVTLRRMTMCQAQVAVDVGDDRLVHGFSADLLAPKWFE